jgi:hypothetical protein
MFGSGQTFMQINVLCLKTLFMGKSIIGYFLVENVSRKGTEKIMSSYSVTNKRLSKRVMTVLLSVIMLVLVIVPTSAMADSSMGGGNI